MIPNEQKPHYKRHDLLNSILGAKDLNQMKQSKQSPLAKKPRKMNNRASESFGAPGPQFPPGRSSNPTPNFVSGKSGGLHSEHTDQAEASEYAPDSREKQIFKSLKHQALLKIINNENAAFLQSVVTKGRKSNGSKGPKKSSKNKKLAKSSCSTSDLHSFSKENEMGRFRPTSGGNAGSSNGKKNPKRLLDLLCKNPLLNKQPSTTKNFYKKKLSSSANENCNHFASLAAGPNKSVFDRLHQTKVNASMQPAVGETQPLSPKWVEFKRELYGQTKESSSKLFYRPSNKQSNFNSPMGIEGREKESKAGSKKLGVSERGRSPKPEQGKSDVKIEDFLRDQKGRQQANVSLTPKGKKSEEVTFFTPKREERRRERGLSKNNNNNSKQGGQHISSHRGGGNLILDQGLNQYSSFNGKLTQQEIEKNFSQMMSFPVVENPYNFFSDLQRLINEMALTNPDIAGCLIKMRICFEKLVSSIQQVHGFHAGQGLQGPTHLKNVKFQDEILEESPAQKSKQNYFGDPEFKSENAQNKLLSGTSTEFTSKSRGVYSNTTHQGVPKFAENKSTERTVNSAFTTKREYIQNEENIYLKSQLVDMRNTNNKLLEVIKRSMRIFGKLKAKGIDVEKLFEKKMEVLLYQDVPADYALKEEKLNNILQEFEKSLKKDEEVKQGRAAPKDKEAAAGGIDKTSNQFSGGSVAEFKTHYSGSERKAADRYNKSDEDSNKEDFILNKLEQRFYQGPFAVRPSHIDRHMESYNQSELTSSSN